MRSVHLAFRQNKKIIDSIHEQPSLAGSSLGRNSKGFLQGTFSPFTMVPHCVLFVTAGHVYAIGDCGGAMQESRCPECNASIGGRNHALTSGNRHAGEMDGSTHAAWSDAANMGNYGNLH
jgi:hypothetical protein